MNLMNDPWIPVRSNGQRVYIRIADIADETFQSFDFPMPEIEFAAIELLIGILAMAMPPKSISDWEKGLHKAPEPSALLDALSPYAHAFNLLGDGPRFAQFPTQRDNKKEAPNPISRLVFGAPGANTEVKNLDLIVHRRPDMTLSPADAIPVLFGYQTRIMGVGSGNKSSSRGGSHVTALRDFRQKFMAPPLWTLIWGNVPILSKGRLDPAHTEHALPWMRVEKISPATKDLGDALQVSKRPDIEEFFATSRRLWLETDDAEMISGYTAIPHGFTYAGWQHPLSPSIILPAKGDNPGFRSFSVVADDCSGILQRSMLVNQILQDENIKGLFQTGPNGASANIGDASVLIAIQRNDKADIAESTIISTRSTPGANYRDQAYEELLQLYNDLKFAMKKAFGICDDARILSGQSLESATLAFQTRIDDILQKAPPPLNAIEKAEFVIKHRNLFTNIARSGYRQAFAKSVPTAVGKRADAIFRGDSIFTKFYVKKAEPA